MGQAPTGIRRDSGVGVDSVTWEKANCKMEVENLHLAICILQFPDHSFPPWLNLGVLGTVAAGWTSG